MTRRLAITVTAALTVGMLAVGCGDDDSGTATPATTADSGSSAGGALQVDMGEYSFSPQDATAQAGSVTISAPNVGALVHELVLAKTDEDATALPTIADGDVDEAKLEAQEKIAGEIADVEAGATKEGTFELTPGNYVMFCNIPGHYAEGMYGTLTVE